MRYLWALLYSHFVYVAIDLADGALFFNYVYFWEMYDALTCGHCLGMSSGVTNIYLYQLEIITLLCCFLLNLCVGFEINGFDADILKRNDKNDGYINE